MLGLGVIAGATYALWRAIEQRTRESTLEWTPQPLPSPPMPVPHIPESATDTAPADPPDAAAWADPVDGTCPPTHPVKAKLSSGIFHVPGGQMYDRTVPDRCYVDAAAAEADGLRPSKR